MLNLMLSKKTYAQSLGMMLFIWLGLIACSNDSDADESANNLDADTQKVVDTNNIVDTEIGYTQNPSTISCEDNSAQFTFGVSSFGGVRQWAIDANQLYGANFHYLYLYILDGGMENSEDFRDWYIVPFIEAAESINAVPFFTFYQLLNIGQRLGHSGSEMEVVQACIESSDCMNSYFSNFVWFLKVINEHAPQAIVHVEPDSWGFMMWAMGIEGNDNPLSVPVQVGACGFADVAEFENNAAGLGNALLALRDTYAPQARMGWHASNFRVGTRPEVVTSFYSKMGNWDLLVGESMHNEEDESTWWLPWDEALVEINQVWINTVTEAARIPMILWQLPVGNYDYHLLADGSDYGTIETLASAGVIGALFEHTQSSGADNPDDYRGFREFASVPPQSSDAGGTAADMRDRVVTYASNPVPIPSGSICLPAQ